MVRLLFSDSPDGASGIPTRLSTGIPSMVSGIHPIVLPGFSSIISRTILAPVSLSHTQFSFQHQSGPMVK